MYKFSTAKKMQLLLILYLNLTLKLKMKAHHINSVDVLTQLSHSAFGVLCTLSHSSVPSRSEPSGL